MQNDLQVAEPAEDEDEDLTQAQLDLLPNCPYTLEELKKIGITLRYAVLATVNASSL